MADTIFISDLRVDCIIGRAPWERMVKQTVSIDLRLDCDVRRAAAADDVVEGVLDTKALSKRLLAFVAETEFQMLETLAERIGDVVLREFPVQRLRLRLSKPGALRGSKNVGVIITRTRDDAPA